MHRLDAWRLQEILRHHRQHGVMLAATCSVLGGSFCIRHPGLFKGA